MLRNYGHLKLSKHNFGRIKPSTKSSIDLSHHNYLCTRLLQTGLYFYKANIFKGKCSPSSLFKLSYSPSWKEAEATLLLLVAPRCSSEHHNTLQLPTEEAPAPFCESLGHLKPVPVKAEAVTSGRAKTEVEKT